MRPHVQISQATHGRKHVLNCSAQVRLYSLVYACHKSWRQPEGWYWWTFCILRTEICAAFSGSYWKSKFYI